MRVNINPYKFVKACIAVANESMEQAMVFYDHETKLEKRENALAQYSAGLIGPVVAKAILKIHGVRDPEIRELLEACEPARKHALDRSYDHMG